MIDPELLAILACPACQGDVRLHPATFVRDSAGLSAEAPTAVLRQQDAGVSADVVSEDQKIICVKCQRKYPIRGGIPIMLVEEAENS